MEWPFLRYIYYVNQKFLRVFIILRTRSPFITSYLLYRTLKIKVHSLQDANFRLKEKMESRGMYSRKGNAISIITIIELKLTKIIVIITLNLGVVTNCNLRIRK